MEKIKNYRLQKPIIDFQTDRVGFCRAEEAVSGEEREVLWIRKDDSNQSGSVIKRVFRDIKAYLKNFEILGIQRIVDFDEDEANSVSFIAYESIEKSSNSEFNKQDFEQVVKTLDELKKNNWQGFLLDKNTVVKNNSKEVKIRFIGLFELFQKGIIPYEIPEDNKKRLMSDDIIAISNIFNDYLLSSETGKNIQQKCQSGEYGKYLELLNDIRELPNEENPDYQPIQVTYNENTVCSEKLINELNSGCWWIIENEFSRQDEVQIKWSTNNANGKFFVQEKHTQNDKIYGVLFVSFFDNKPLEHILQNRQRAKFKFKDGNFEDTHYPIPDFLTKPEINRLAQRNQDKEKSLKIWKALPENEKEHIEDQAFKVKYKDRRCSTKNKENIVFNLEENFVDWEKVKNKKNEGVILSINDSYIGQILDYDQSKKTIVIRDCKKSLAAIPEIDELIEDVQQKTSQYKKQIEACEKFGHRDIANPELAAFIATPEAMPPPGHLNIDYDEFEEKIISQDLKQDETQKNAVIEALHRKPIYLIQGPPGTGKTTVIVEMIQQFINRKSDLKILVVSQSNTAVDNVLERLPEKIKFIRFASEDAVDKEKISKKIVGHTFETKLKGWVTETRKRSENYFENFFSDIDKPLLSLYKQFIQKKISKLKDFKKLYQKSTLFKNHYEKLFGEVQNIAEVRRIFKKTLGDKCINLQQTHSNWLAFLNNATSKKKNENISKVQYGNYDIGLDIAYVKSMNVFGSTCIHIASSKYSSINLEFDVMIMDESSKATDAEALVPINMSKQIILIGDHKQLPPVITREKQVKEKIKEDLEDEGLDIDKIYGKSMFERLITFFENNNQCANLYSMLDIQYRMPRQIGYLISQNIYGGKLKNPSLDRVKDYDENKSHCFPLKTSTVTTDKEELPNSIILISTSKEAKPYDNDNKFKRINDCNIEVVKKTLEIINCMSNKNKQPATEIGVIAAYRGQVGQLKNNITKKYFKNLDIDINTVDQFQGSEKDIIIYDVVRSSEGKSSIGFLDDYRRINVAFSRARKLLIVIGDSDYILDKVQCNPNSKVQHRDELHLVKIFKQLKEWNCIFSSFEEALNHDK